jgi:hypothetical protein
MAFKSPTDYPIEYLEGMISGFLDSIREYDAVHLEASLSKTRELLEKFKNNDIEAISQFYNSNKRIKDNLGTGFFQVLRFVEEYLNIRNVIT